METDPLQQLRDIHLPLEPSWWPPAFGWWIVLLLIVGLSSWLITEAIRAWRRRAPIRAARKLYIQLHRQLKDGTIDDQTYSHQCNELLKRLLVHGLGRKNLAPYTDTRWLLALDNISGESSFSDGAGQILGSKRFQSTPEIDADGLHLVMAKFLKVVKP